MSAAKEKLKTTDVQPEERTRGRTRVRGETERKTERTEAQKTRRRGTATTSSEQPDNELSIKLAKIAELNRGLVILRKRMAESKSELLAYFDQHPELKTAKYNVSGQIIRYNDRNYTEGLSQRRVLAGICEYLKESGVAEDQIPHQSREIMEYILNQRGRKVVPSIMISHPDDPDSTGGRSPP